MFGSPWGGYFCIHDPNIVKNVTPDIHALSFGTLPARMPGTPKTERAQARATGFDSVARCPAPKTQNSKLKTQN
jgi:hypothetical protein